jgi:mannose-1-phosphate guanylyltransferase
VNILMLAAGLGSRLRPITNYVPKPCIPFLNVPLGLWNFRFTQHLPVSKMVVNTFHLPEQIVDLYSNQNYFSGRIEFSHEQEKILGSAGGLKKAESLFTDDGDNTILMLNADEVFFPEDEEFLKKAYLQHKKNKNLATLVTISHPEAGQKFGAIWCEGVKVKNIGKNKISDAHRPLHYIGMIFLDKRLLNHIPENTEYNIFYDLLIHKLAEQQIEVYNSDGAWFETGNFSDFFSAVKSALSALDNKTLSYISRYDDSRILQNTGGCSLVSNQFQNLTAAHFSGHTTVAKTTNPTLLQASGLLSDSVFFSSYQLNADYSKI